MDGHVVKLVHGYGAEPLIKIDKTLLKNVESYSISGKAGELPKLTVTLIATSVVAEEERKLFATEEVKGAE